MMANAIVVVTYERSP